jgi:phosphoenolpyruvate carboxykinase (GTP)
VDLRSLRRAQGHAVETSIGPMPTPKDLDLSGLQMPDADLQELLHVDAEGWKAEAASIHEHFAKMGDHVPAELHTELKALEQRLAKA